MPALSYVRVVVRRQRCSALPKTLHLHHLLHPKSTTSTMCKETP